MGEPIASQRNNGSAATDSSAEVFEVFLRRYGSELLGVARRHSLTGSDAEDALQSAVEKLLTKRPAENPSAIFPWMVTVVKNEARMIMRRHRRQANLNLVHGTDRIASPAANPSDLVIDKQELSFGREALLRISPDQARCLLLRADGLSYEEIAEVTGFTFSKVHRVLHEGRRVYRGLLQRIETGAECRRLEPFISKFVDGEASSAERRDVQMHVKNCGSCRATLRDFNVIPHAIATALPLAAAFRVNGGGGTLDRITENWGNVVAWVNERAFGHAVGAHMGELAVVKKIALATAAAGTLVAGGTAVEQIAVDKQSAVTRSTVSAKSRPEVSNSGQDTLKKARDEKEEETGNGSGDSSPAAATATDVIESDVGVQKTSDTSTRERSKTQSQRVEVPGPSQPMAELPEDAIREQIDERDPAQ